jgi:CRP/FNR family transcriptional regulator
MRDMKTKPAPSSRSGKQDTQADAFFSAFFTDPKNNRHYQGQVQLYPAKTVIVKQDTPANAVYLIEQGLVKLVRETSNGSTVIVGLRHRDWLIGAPTVLLDRPYNFTVMTVVPSLLRAVPKNEFLDHIQKNGEFSWHVQRLLSQQILDQMKRIEAMRCLSAEKRLMGFLSDTVREMDTLGPGSSDGFTLPLTNQELAQLLMITPEHLCRVMKKMGQKGLVRHGKGTLVVIDPSGLRQAAT